MMLYSERKDDKIFKLRYFPIYDVSMIFHDISNNVRMILYHMDLVIPSYLFCGGQYSYFYFRGIG